MLPFSAAALAGSLAIILTGLLAFQRSLYISALCLLGAILEAAVLFYFSGAPTLAFLQILIYAGAVMVVVVVAIMAAPIVVTQRWNRRTIPKPLAGLAALLCAAAFTAALSRAPAPPALPPGPGEALLGATLFGPYAVATEAVTVLILLAALAVVEERR